MTEFAISDLKTIYPTPTPRVIAKARPEIDAYAAKFIGMSPFCVLATSGSDGSVDASPRGGDCKRGARATGRAPARRRVRLLRRWRRLEPHLRVVARAG